MIEQPSYREMYAGTGPLPLTEQEARKVELPSLLHPIARLGELARLGESYGLQQVGQSPLPQYLTRGDLVRTAREFDTAIQTIEMCDEIDGRQ